MEKDNFKTKVVFREFKNGEVLALFPEIDEGNYTCSSYMHIGQHGAADYSHCISITKPAKDFSALKKELEDIGYVLEIRQKYIRVRN